MTGISMGRLSKRKEGNPPGLEVREGSPEAIASKI